MRMALLIGLMSLMAAGTAQAAGNAKSGEQVFARCGLCHSNAKGDGNKIGPNLFGVVGRKAGTAPQFSYSAAMKSAGFVWTNDKLDAWIKSPPTVVPGNKMMFAGIPFGGTARRPDRLPGYVEVGHHWDRGRPVRLREIRAADADETSAVRRRSVREPWTPRACPLPCVWHSAANAGILQCNTKN